MTTPDKEFRILSLKTSLVLLLIFSASIILYFIYFLYYYLLAPESNALWLAIVRLLANAFLVTSVVGYIFERVLRRETEAKLASDINTAISRLQAALPETLASSLIYNKSAIKQLLSGDRIDEMFTWCLEYHLKDATMASELKDSLFQEIFQHTDRWYNLAHYITLRDFPDGPMDANSRSAYLLFEDHVSYRTRLTRTDFKFVCTETPPDSEKYLRDRSYYSTWQFRAAFLDAFKQPYFHVDRILIENLPLHTERTILSKNVVEIVALHNDLVDLIGKHVQVDYLIRSVVRKEANSFNIEIPFPTKDLRVTFDISKTDLGRASICTFFTTKAAPMISYDDSLNPKIIDTYLADWLFPVSGMSFVWQKQPISFTL